MKKRDMQIIIVLILIAIISFVFIRNSGRLTEQSDIADNYVNIYVGDIEYKKVPLSEPQTVVIDIDGKYNEIEVHSNGVFMKDSNCDNQDCMHQGKITLDNVDTRIMGGWIICLPNQVSIELVEGES